MTDADKGMDPVHFGSDPVDTGIRTNLEIRIRIQSHFRLRQPSWRWRRYTLSGCSLVKMFPDRRLHSSALKQWSEKNDSSNGIDTHLWLLDVSLLCQFATWTFRHLDVSLPGRFPGLWACYWNKLNWIEFLHFCVVKNNFQTVLIFT